MQKKTLYFLRHGQSVYNKLNILQGQIDSPLSEEGEKQAYDLAPRFKNLNLKHIAHSPLLRAKQTAEIVNKQLNLPLSEWEDIREISFGKWQHELKYEYWEDFRRDFYEHGTPPPGGESRNELYRRVEKEVHRIVNTVNESPILIACHGMVIRILIGEWFTNATEKSFRSLKVPNLSVYKVDIEHDKEELRPTAYEYLGLLSKN
ncbi:hypothetical protein GF369_00750 [Candidatus Peregrinibacteria bacterium]|nr:hypothetical protein [Candidatus Peregrinibacteria bacterium]